MVEFSLTIDGQEHKVSPMQNLRIFLDEHGIQNFGLCHHEKIISSGKCDLCLVEIDGELIRSCEVFITTDIEVKTNSSLIKHGIEKSFSLLAKDHKTDCERCHQSGVCKIQNFARNHELNLGSFEENRNSEEEKIDLALGYQLDQSRCVNCTLCIDYSQKIAKDDLFFHYGRAGEQRVDFNSNAKNFSELGLYRDLCPAGAIAHQDDFKVGERGRWHEVKCIGCSEQCDLMARTIAKRFIDIRASEVGGKSCEAGRRWWREIDLWRTHEGISLRAESGEMIPASLSEVKEVVPKNIKWQVLLASDLSVDEVKEWTNTLQLASLEAAIFLPQRDDFYREIGPKEYYCAPNTPYPITYDLLDRYDGLIVVEPLWRFNAKFLRDLKRRSRELVLFSSGPLVDNLALVQVNRFNWITSPLLPARQSESLQGIIDVLQAKD